MRSDDHRIVILLLRHGADANARDGMYRDALSAALSCGNLDHVHALLSNGANLANLNSDRSDRAMFWALQSNHTSLIELLLNEKIDPSKTLLAASKFGREDVVKICLDRGADINHMDSKSKTAIYYAELNEKSNTVSLLLQEGAKQGKTESMLKNKEEAEQARSDRQLSDRHSDWPPRVSGWSAPIPGEPQLRSCRAPYECSRKSHEEQRKCRESR